MSHKSIIYGIDEAGRGPIAGPLVVACVALHQSMSLVFDSKSISVASREIAYKEIINHAKYIGIGIVKNNTIDELGLTKSLQLAIKKATNGINNSSSILVFDGNYIPSSNILTVVKGDMYVNAIAAASIVAKKTRDDLMKEISHNYKKYKFEQHKGYPTSMHKQLLKQFGPCALHRKSFKPVQNVLRSVKSSQ